MKLIINGGLLICSKGTTLPEVSHSYFQGLNSSIVAACLNGEAVSLNKKISLAEGDVIEYIDYYHPLGRDIVGRSLSFLFLKACSEIVPKAQVSIDKWSFFDVKVPDFPEFELSAFLLRKIEDQMKAWVERDLIFLPIDLTKDAFIQHLKSRGEADFFFENEALNCQDFYTCDGYINGASGVLVPSTLCLKAFSLSAVDKNKVLLTSSCCG